MPNSEIFTHWLQHHVLEWWHVGVCVSKAFFLLAAAFKETVHLSVMLLGYHMCSTQTHSSNQPIVENRKKNLEGLSKQGEKLFSSWTFLPETRKVHQGGFSQLLRFPCVHRQQLPTMGCCYRNSSNQICMWFIQLQVDNHILNYSSIRRLHKLQQQSLWRVLTHSHNSLSSLYRALWSH